jgi:hypothetical protein
MRWHCGTRASCSSSLTCLTFVNCLLAVLERACNSTKSHSEFKSAYTKFCDYLLPASGSISQCVWAGCSTAHAAADFIVLCKLILPNRIFILYHRLHLRCVKLQAMQRGHLIRKKWRLGPSSATSPVIHNSHSTQRLATQAISAAATQFNAPWSLSPAPAAVQRRYTAKLSAAAQDVLAAHRAWYSTAATAAVLAGVLPVHAAGIVRFSAACISVTDLVGVEKQKAFIELKRLVNRMSRFLRGCVQRQTFVAVAAAMSLVRRASSDLQSLELFPLQFPVGISHVLLKSFSSGLKLHSAVRALLSDMRSHLAGASLLLRRRRLCSSPSEPPRYCNSNIIAVCASGLQQLRLPARSIASFFRLHFRQDMPQGHSRLDLAPLAYSPGVTRNQQVAALCFGQPLQGGRCNGPTHFEWLERHWSGLAVAGALHAMQDYQLFQLMLTVDSVMLGGEQKSKAATRSTIAAAHAAEGHSTMQRNCHSAVRDAAIEFLTVCARVGARRAVLHASLPSRDNSASLNSATYLQSTLMLFNDLSNNFLLQLTPRQRGLLVTNAFIAAFQMLVCVVHIQRCTRGRAARCIVRAALHHRRSEQHERRREDAQDKISRSFRFHRARCILRGIFAVRVQRVWRGHIVRKDLVSAKAAFQAKIKIAAAQLIQRHWEHLMIQRWFSSVGRLLNNRSRLSNEQKDEAVICCAQNPSRIWSLTLLPTDFISCVCFRGLHSILLSNQKNWMTAGLLRQRNMLLNNQSQAFESFMAKATSEAQSICAAKICRAWKCHFYRKHVSAMLQTARKIKHLASSFQASTQLQQAWRARCSRLQFCAELRANQTDKERYSSSIIVKNVLCFRSRCRMQFLRRVEAACALQRSYRVHVAVARMSEGVQLFSILRREAAVGRLQSVVRGWISRQKCCRDARRIAALMLSWNRTELLRYDCRLRLAVVIGRHRPFICSNEHIYPLSSSEFYDAAAKSRPATSTVAILRCIAAACCSFIGKSIAEWGFKCIRKEKNRRRILAQMFALHTTAVLRLQAVYRAHLHRRNRFKPFLPKYRMMVTQRRRVAAATLIQCLWRSSVARLALACLSAAAMRGRWMTRTRWAHSRASNALKCHPHPRARQVDRTDVSRATATKVQDHVFFHAKLNGWCVMAHLLVSSVLLPDDFVAIQFATSSSFELCERIVGFTGTSPSSDRFFGSDNTVALLLQQIENVCPQLTSRCWDTVCSRIPNDAVIFSADPALSPARAILSYFRQFVSGMIAQRKTTRESDAVLFNLRSASHAASARAGFVVQLPADASSSLRRMLLHSSAVVLASLHWLFTRWGRTELMGNFEIGRSFMFPVSHDSEFVHECHGVWTMLLHCQVRPILFCLEMLVSSMSRTLFESLHGAAAAFACNAISACLMLMSFWLQTTCHPQNTQSESSLWILFSACTLESRLIDSYLDESLRSNAPSIRLNVIQLLHASVQEHLACVSAALGQQSESMLSLMRAENLLRQLSTSSISSRHTSDNLHGPPSPAEQLCWRKVAESSAMLFDCCSGNAASSDQ